MSIILNNLKTNIYSAFLVITIFLPFFYAKSVPFLIFLLLIFWIFKFNSFANLHLKFKMIWPFMFYGFTFLIVYFLGNNSQDGLKILERQSSFILLPFLIIFKDWSKSELLSFGKYYVNVVLLISISSLILLFYFYITHIDFVRTMDETYLQWKLPHLMGFHPTYFGLAIVIANMMLLTSIEKKKNIFRVSSFYIVIFLTFYLIYLSPRTSIICQLLVWFWFICSRIFTKNTKKLSKISVLTISIFIIGILLYTSTYVINKFFNSFSDRRFLLWDPAFEIIRKNYFIFGEGLGGGMIKINNFISENNLNQFEVPDLHNQYLMNYLDLGILGLIIILIILFIPIIYSKSKELILFTIVFSISMLTESFLYVIKGIIFFITISCFFNLKNSFKSEEIKNYNS